MYNLAMHEMSIAESMLQIVKEAALTEGYTKVKRVWLEVGQLAIVEKDSLRFCFDVVARDTLAQDAQLEIIETPGRGQCLQCSTVVAITTLLEPCPKCGSFQIAVTGGQELRVKELEAE